MHLYSTNKKYRCNLLLQLCSRQSFILSEQALHIHILANYYVISISRIQNLVILASSRGAVADTISAVLALGHLFGLSLSDAEIADGHDAAILVADPHSGTLFLAAK